ncbi:hypothetical protein BKA67DRAFT_97096 [Truncatella angustata]|uniref:Secreted protein n=1 Tax=Truncatella angustata TaxID=152316 RepID=A0A9P8RI38_9PEZI|nr:uncharacterized protein BKA67DRAFT_97096 [Truncatella angustata]KAH6646244.1 hypothetical protein BKA67DRAFT_97096 [Truncatella angustata]
MHISLYLFSLLFCSVLADGPCDVMSDSCRSVINASACFNEFLAGGGNKDPVLNCLVGTDGSDTPEQKMCACTGCLGPAMLNWISKVKICT